MAVSLNRFVVTQTVTIPAGTFATVAAGEPGTGGPAGYGNEELSATGGGGTVFPEMVVAGSVLLLDSGTPSELYTYLNGLSALRAYVQGQDDVGHAALSN
jgi:hypothetical protein